VIGFCEQCDEFSDCTKGSQFLNLPNTLQYILFGHEVSPIDIVG
jgi:hypothetical protein